MKTKILVSIMLCGLLLLSPLSAFAETPPPEGDGLTISEICFNPKWKEGDANVEESTDMFPYTEIYNPTSRSISLAELSLCYRSDSARVDSDALICAGDAPTLAPGEVAVIVHYTEHWAKLGLDNTAEQVEAVYETFVELHGITDVLSKNCFFIVSNKNFGLDKTSETATMELFCGGYINSFTYNAAFYNRSNRAVIFGTDGTCMGTTVPNPGSVYVNQIPNNPALVPNTLTIPIKAVEYNICASGIPDDYEDIPFIADRCDEALGLIKQEAPDLIVLCEVNFAWQAPIQEFCEQNNYTAYGFSSAGRDFHGNLGKQKWDLTSLILWKTDRFEVVETNRFWCSSTPDRKNSNKWEGGLVGDMARCINYAVLKDKESGVEFLLLGAHLDAKSEEVRALSAQLIYDRSHEIAGTRPIIMLGDWNANQTHESYRILTSGDLADARFCTYTTNLHGTFNKWGAYSADFQTRLPIDHCIISKDKIWVDFYKQVGGEPIENVPHPSDHNMTVFSLQITTGEPIPETAAPETEQPEENTGHEQSGCKSMLCISPLPLIPLALLLTKKKKHS